MPLPVQFGEPAPRGFDRELVADGKSIPGLGWKISKDAQRALEAMDENIRVAEQQSGSFRLD